MFNFKMSRPFGLLLALLLVTSFLFPQDTYANPLEKIKVLNNQSADFYDLLLRYQGQFVPKNLLNEHVRTLESETEKYLSSIQVLYKKEVRTLEDVQFEGAVIEKISHAVYVIQRVNGEDEDLDPNAQFIKAVLNSSYMQKNKLILNPFLQVESSRIQGYFEAENQKIEIGVTALSYRVSGLGDTLAHELRHAEEQWKIENGQSSLASWVLRGKENPEDPYSQFLRLDEIVTHRMDIEFLKVQGPLLEKNNTDSAKLKSMREFRSKNLDFKKVMLQKMEERALKSLYWLMSVQSEGKVSWQCSKVKVQLLSCQTKDLSSADAKFIEVQFSQSLGASVDEVILSLIYEAVGSLSAN